MLTLLFIVIVSLVLSGIIGTAFQVLFPGLGAVGTFLVLTACLVGSYLNIPLVKLQTQYEAINIKYVTVFGVTYPAPTIERGTKKTVLAVNLGGAVIPMVTSIYLFLQTPSVIPLALLITLFVAVIVYAVSRPVKGLGIIVPALIPPLAAALLAILTGGEWPHIVAYTSGTLGTLIGADLLRLNNIRRLGSAMVSIGGAGTFDGIFLAGVIAVLLAI
jgi:uncharacterized membrane protein